MFRLINPVDRSTIKIIFEGTKGTLLGEYTHHDLMVDKAVYIFPGTVVTLVHDVHIIGEAWVVPAPGVLSTRTLMVGMERVVNGQAKTTVVNLGPERQFLRKGESVSMLVAL